MATEPMRVLREQISEVIEKFVNDDGIVEIVTRNAKKKFKEFYKFQIIDLPKKSNDNKVAKFLEVISNDIKELSKNADLLDNKLKDLSKLQMFNSVLNCANLCATVAGFAIVCYKLDEMNENINAILEQMKKTGQLEANYKLDTVISEYKDMLDYKRLEKKYDNDKTRKLIDSEVNVLKLLYAYFIDDLGTDKSEVLYSIIALSQMMKCTIYYYDEAYYFENKDLVKDGYYWHASHDTWMKALEMLKSKTFVSTIQDLVFLEKGLNQYETDLFVTSIINDLNESIETINDHQKLMKNFENINQYHNFEFEVNKLIKNSIIEEANNISNSDVEFKNHITESLVAVGIN